jgi:hypothetical protein
MCVLSGWMLLLSLGGHSAACPGQSMLYAAVLHVRKACLPVHGVCNLNVCLPLLPLPIMTPGEADWSPGAETLKSAIG